MFATYFTRWKHGSGHHEQLSELPFRSFLSIATLACIAKREDSDGRAEARGGGAGHAQEEGEGAEGAAFFRTGNGERNGFLENWGKR